MNIDKIVQYITNPEEETYFGFPGELFYVGKTNDNSNFYVFNKEGIYDKLDNLNNVFIKETIENIIFFEKRKSVSRLKSILDIFPEKEIIAFDPDLLNNKKSGFIDYLMIFDNDKNSFSGFDVLDYNENLKLTYIQFDLNKRKLNKINERISDTRNNLMESIKTKISMNKENKLFSEKVHLPDGTIYVNVNTLTCPFVLYDSFDLKMNNYSHELYETLETIFNF